MAKIAIIGVGAIGGVVAMLLKNTGLHDIMLCTRRPMEKLIVKTSEESMSESLPNITDPMAAEAVDWVLVATKVYDTQSASAWFQHLCGKNTVVAILQNGVEHRENFSAFLSPGTILPVIVDCPAERHEDGSILQRGVARFQVENHRIGSEFMDLFQGSKAEVILTDDFLTASWQKLCMNAAGAIPALLMKPTGVLHDEEPGRVALEIIAECVAVGKAEGAHLEEGIGRKILERYRSMPPDSINSILADRIAGRPMEIEARNGAVVRKGEKHGIPTPVNKMVVARLKSAYAAERSWTDDNRDQ